MRGTTVVQVGLINSSDRLRSAASFEEHLHTAVLACEGNSMRVAGYSQTSISVRGSEHTFS
jgi:hypothetical protein